MVGNQEWNLIVCFCRVGLVESKLRILIGNLERNHLIEMAHVNAQNFEQQPVDARSANSCLLHSFYAIFDNLWNQ